MLSSCGLSIQGAEGDLSRWGNTGRLFSTDEMLELKLTQTRKFCILLFHEGVTGDWCGGFEVFLHSLSNEQLSCLILKHAGSVACWFMPYHKLASLFPSISLTHSNTPTVVLLVLLLEKQRRRMNMHDVIQVWHTVHAAMHCVSLLVKQEKAGRALTCGTATSTCPCLQTCVCVRTAYFRDRAAS